RAGDRAATVPHPDAESVRAGQGSRLASGCRDPHRSRDGARSLHRTRAGSTSCLSFRFVQILDGKAVAARVLAEVKTGVQRFAAQTGGAPTLAVVLVGDFAPSKIYVRGKKRAADEVGIASRDYLFPEGCSQETLLATLREINGDPSVHAILLQLPLPEGLDEDGAINAIAPQKDADGLHPCNLGNLLAGQPVMVPCTPAGCLEILDSYGVELRGADAVVLGRSRLVGKPLAQLLLGRHATVTMCHTRTRDLATHTRRA